MPEGAASAGAGAQGELTELRVAGVTCICRPRLEPELRRVYAAGSSVFRELQEREESLVLFGRKPLLAGHFGGGHVLVKRLFHGGFFAKVTGDRFLTPRRFRNHLACAEFLASQGVATPETLFVAWRRRWLFARGEIGVRYLPRAFDASSHLFPPKRIIPEDWRERVEAVATLTARLHRLGVEHGDLNLRNFLFTPAAELLILDLDKAVRRQAPLASATRRRNLARLERSIYKEGREAPVRDVEAVVHKLHAAYRSAYAGGALR